MERHSIKERIETFSILSHQGNQRKTLVLTRQLSINPMIDFNPGRNSTKCAEYMLSATWNKLGFAGINTCKMMLCWKWPSWKSSHRFSQGWVQARLRCFSVKRSLICLSNFTLFHLQCNTNTVLLYSLPSEPQEQWIVWCKVARSLSLLRIPWEKKGYKIWLCLLQTMLH